MMVASGVSEPAYISLPPGLSLCVEPPDDEPLRQEKNNMIGWDMLEGISMDTVPDKIVIL